MNEYSRTLGDVVKRTRGKLGLTQSEVAEAANVDVRTVLNIENYKGNPKMEVLYSLIRTLKIDAGEIFYPEMQRDSPSITQIRLLIEECSEEEAAALMPVFQTMITAIREKNTIHIKKEPAIPLITIGKLASHFMRPSHLSNTILSCTTFIVISFLHLGQYNGNFIRTVSSYTFVLVLLLQIGQCTHKDFFLLLFIF